jgi:hypothetical protein
MWIYASAVLDGFGMSIVTLVNMIFLWIFASFSNFGFDYLTVPGFYFFLAFIQIFPIVFLIFYVKDTKGKTKEE